MEKKITGTIAEGRAYRADVSWKRFFKICDKSSRLRPFLRDFQPVADFLTGEESMWPQPSSMAVGMDDFFQRQAQVLLAPGSPYLLSDPERLSFLKSNRSTYDKIHLIDLMRRIFDRPLMVLAMIELCARRANSAFWLDLQNHISAVIKTPSPLAFRKTWLDHAMQVSGCIKKSGASCPRQWARLLVSGKAAHLQNINAKAIEINSWLKGKKQPSVENIQRTWQAIVTVKTLHPAQAESQSDRWLFSWMITLWLEDNFKEVSSRLNDEAKIQIFYRRFFDYIGMGITAFNGKWAGG